MPDPLERQPTETGWDVYVNTADETITVALSTWDAQVAENERLRQALRHFESGAAWLFADENGTRIHPRAYARRVLEKNDG